MSPFWNICIVFKNTISINNKYVNQSKHWAFLESRTAHENNASVSAESSSVRFSRTLTLTDNRDPGGTPSLRLPEKKKEGKGNNENRRNGGKKKEGHLHWIFIHDKMKLNCILIRCFKVSKSFGGSPPEPPYLPRSKCLDESTVKIQSWVLDCRVFKYYILSASLLMERAS